MRHHARRLVGLVRLREAFDPGANRLAEHHILPVADQLFLQPHGLRACRKQRIETFVDGGIELVRRDHLLDQPPSQRGRRIDVLAEQEKFARAAPADQPGQQRGLDHGRNADLHFGHPEHRVG